MEGTISLFGFPSPPAQLEVRSRSTTWRVWWCSAFMGGGVLLALVVGLVPPHAPWMLGALGIGAFLGVRKWREQFTVLALRGLCPKCRGPLSLSSGTPLRAVMTLPCSGCNHDSRLLVDLQQEPSVGGEGT